MGHRIPVWSHAAPLHRDNAVLAGDVAGFADTLWREGISYALTLAPHLCALQVQV